MHYPLDKGRKTNEYKGLVTHNDILKIYKLLNILKIFSSVTW